MQKFYWISKFLNRVFLKLMMLRNAPYIIFKSHLCSSAGK